MIERVVRREVEPGGRQERLVGSGIRTRSNRASPIGRSRTQPRSGSRHNEPRVGVGQRAQRRRAQRPPPARVSRINRPNAVPSPRECDRAPDHRAEGAEGDLTGIPGAISRSDQCERRLDRVHQKRCTRCQTEVRKQGQQQHRHDGRCREEQRVDRRIARRPVPSQSPCRSRRAQRSRRE